MNTNRRNRGKNRDLVSYQTPETVQAVEGDENEVSTKSTFVKDSEFGEIHKGTFSISVTNKVKNPTSGKMEEKTVYENKEEPFEYERVTAFTNLLKKFGANLSDDKEKFIMDALKDTDEDGNETEDSKSIGEALAKILKNENVKFKADAKQSAYAAIVNKNKPLEGAQRETAIARTVKNVVQLAGISAESAIEMLKSKGAVPEDYTVADYEATPLRRAKGADTDDDE